MIIQKGKASAIFHKRGLQLTPEVIPAIDRQVTLMIEQLAVVNLAKGLKRLKAEDVFPVGAPQTPLSERSGSEAGKGTENAISPNPATAGEDNPSKIPGPCSRCVGIHDRVIRIAREIETQINEGAVFIYKEQLRNF